MDNNKLLKLILWMLISFSLFTLAFEMISAPNTMENVIGSLIVIALAFLSLKTNCFTSIYIKKKKDNEKK